MHFYVLRFSLSALLLCLSLSVSLSLSFALSLILAILKIEIPVVPSVHAAGVVMRASSVCVWAEWKRSLFNVSAGRANELSL